MSHTDALDDPLDLLENAPCAFHSLGPDGVIRRVNATWLRWLGYTRDEVEGKLAFREVLTEASQATFTALFPKFEDRRQLDEVELTLRRKDGSTLPILLSASAAYDDDGHLLWSRSAFIDITRHKRAEEHSRRLIALAPDPTIVVDTEGRIEFANPQVERTFGYSAAELTGQPVEILIPERARTAHAGHLGGFMRSPRARAIGVGLELVGRRKDGSELPIEVNLSPFEAEDGMRVVAAIRDTSERSRARAATQQARDRLVDAVESIDDAFAIFGADTVLVMHNSAFRLIYEGVVDGPLVGRRIEHLALALAAAEGMDPARCAEFVARWLTMLEMPRTVHDLERLGRTYKAVTRRTRDGGAVLVLSDRTEERQHEVELRQASAAKSDFLSAMSHELRTPLNAILGFSQLLQRDRKTPPTERQRGMLAHVVSGGEHLLRLIDDILDLARIEDGRVAISIEPVNVAEAVSQAVATLAPMAARAQVELVVTPSIAAVGYVLADRTRLAQILMNYGSNAIKYGHSGGHAVFAASQATAGRVCLSVSDDGGGIPLDKQPQVFQPFYRAGQEAGPIEGTGIGLAFTRRLADLMGGTVGFTSRPGAGSEFWAEFDRADAIARPPAPEQATDSSLAEGAPRQIVVYVEDNPANIAFMRELLSDVPGIELLTAPNAELGVEVIRARRPSVVILDINLPGMSGFDALRLLQSWPETKDIPVIALSAAAMERDVKRGEAAGFFRYLTKPVKLDELLATLELLLRDHASPST